MADEALAQSLSVKESISGRVPPTYWGKCIARMNCLVGAELQRIGCELRRDVWPVPVFFGTGQRAYDLP